MMIFVNEVYKQKRLSKEQAIGFLKLLNPIAPHITEELFQTVFNKKDTLTYQEWPSYDESKLVLNEIEVVIQVNGKLRDRVFVSPDEEGEIVKKKALLAENVVRFTEGKQIVKVIYVPGKLVNVVIKE
jgi:leucyl-tRNA synthetase